MKIFPYGQVYKYNMIKGDLPQKAQSVSIPYNQVYKCNGFPTQTNKYLALGYQSLIIRSMNVTQYLGKYKQTTGKMSINPLSAGL